MGNSVVDLGAAGEYISEKFDDFVDYMTGAPEARASDTYIVRKSRKGQTLYGGEDPRGETFAEFFGISGFEDGGIVELGEGSPMSVATKEELEEFLEFLRRNRPSYKEGETGEYRAFPILGMQEIDPNAKVMIDGKLQQAPRDTVDYAGQSMGREEFYEGFADTASGITEEDIQSGVASLTDLQDSASLGDPFAGREGSFVPQQIEIEDGKVTTNPIGFENGGGIGGLMQMSTQTRLNDRDDAVGTKLMRQAGLQASANQVMDNLDPKILSQMSRILGRDIG
jgi:hypothetical protein